VTKEEREIAKRDDYEERAAILEFDAGMNRADAEIMAERMQSDKFCLDKHGKLIPKWQRAFQRD